MKRLFFNSRASLVLTAIAAFIPKSAHACAACFGQSNDKLAEGMNWGIFTLLVCIVLVLATIATFFVYLARRSSALARNLAATHQLTPENA